MYLHAETHQRVPPIDMSQKEVASALLTLGVPFLVAGDWNCSPVDMKDTSFLRRVLRATFVIHSACLGPVPEAPWKGAAVAGAPTTSGGTPQGRDGVG